MTQPTERTPFIHHATPPSRVPERLFFGGTTLVGLGGVTFTVVKAALSPPFTLFHGVALLFSGLSITSGIFGFWSTRQIHVVRDADGPHVDEPEGVELEPLYRELRKIEALLDPTMDTYQRVEELQHLFAPLRRGVREREIDAERAEITADTIDSLCHVIFQKIGIMCQIIAALEQRLAEEQASQDDDQRTIEDLSDQLEVARRLLAQAAEKRSATTHTVDPEAIRKALEEAQAVAAAGKKFRRRVSFGGTSTPSTAPSSPGANSTGTPSNPPTPSRLGVSPMKRGEDKK